MHGHCTELRETLSLRHDAQWKSQAHKACNRCLQPCDCPTTATEVRAVSWVSVAHTYNPSYLGG
jgi:hypothetical protein